MSHSWEVKEGKQIHYIYLSGGEVTIGNHWGSGHTDNAGVYSFEQMKAGGWDAHIERHFGDDVLQQVRIAIGAAPPITPAESLMPPSAVPLRSDAPPMAKIPFPEFD